jgi:hypothetical protein
MDKGGPPLLRRLALFCQDETLFQKGHEFWEARFEQVLPTVKIAYCHGHGHGHGHGVFILATPSKGK